MRIVIDLTSLADHLSGIERFAANLSYTFIKRNPQNKYILFFKGKVFNLFEEMRTYENVEFVVLKSCNKLIFMQVYLPLELYKYKADYYLFFAFPAPFLFFSKKSISAIHDVGCWDCPETMRLFAVIYHRMLYRKAVACGKKIITVSNFSKNRISQILKKNKSDIYVINGAVTKRLAIDSITDEKCREIRKKYNLAEHYILSLSTLEPRKNLQLLIKAYLKLDKKYDVSLVLAGRKGWKMSQFLEEIGSFENSNINVTGFIDDADLPYVYYMADVFVFPSLYEGFGLPPIEAISMGTLVLSSDAASLPEVLGDAALYFKNGEDSQLLEQLKAVLCMSDAQRNNRRLKGFNLVEKYTWENTAIYLEKLFHDLKR